MHICLDTDIDPNFQLETQTPLIVHSTTLFSSVTMIAHFPQPVGLKRAGSPPEDEKVSKKQRVDDAEITVCYKVVVQYL